MKKLLIMCGTGIATSTIVTGKVNEWLKENELDKNLRVYQSKVADEVSRIDDYDVVISTTLVPDNLKDKVINGIPLLTGIGTEDVFNQLKEKLTSSNN